MLHSAKERAKKNGLHFDLTVDDFEIPEVCPVFKVKFERSTPFAASLDRINSELGYVKGNVQVISRLANTMKSNATKEQLLEFAKWVIDN